MSSLAGWGRCGVASPRHQREGVDSPTTILATVVSVVECASRGGCVGCVGYDRIYPIPHSRLPAYEPGIVHEYGVRVVR